jgi:hypothetical protein
VEPEITPEPSPEERAAILPALADTADPDGRRSAGSWWRLGVLEAVLGDQGLAGELDAARDP